MSIPTHATAQRWRAPWSHQVNAPAAIVATVQRTRYCTDGASSQRLAASAATAAAVAHQAPVSGKRRGEPVDSFNVRSSRVTQPLSAPHTRSAPRPWRLKELRPQQVAEVLSRDARLIVPIGTCEQHGPHMPLGCDTIIVEHLADDFSAEFGVLRAPTLEYGVNVDTEKGFPGNASLRRKTLHRMLNDLIDSWEATGVHEFVLLTAHEHDPHLEALSTVVTSGARIRVIDIFEVDFTDILEAQSEPMHGDEVDTSLLLYLAPELVAADLAQDYMMSRDELRRYRRGWLKVPKGSPGSIGRPTVASAAKGEQIYQRMRGRIRERIFLAAAVEES
jgi:creatinine amidohydrolase